MRRVIPRLFVACFTFALGVSVAALSLELRRPSSPVLERASRPHSQYCDPALSLEPGADLYTAADLPIIPYCELVNNQDCYSGKIVRVGARIFWVENNMFFGDGGCHSQAGERVAVQLHLANAEQVYAIMMQTCGPQCYEPLDVVVVGRFEKFRPPVESMPEWSLPSFKVTSFESASRVR
jgi:hypothetical protein